MTQLKIEMKVTPSLKLTPLQLPGGVRESGDARRGDVPTKNKTDKLSAKIRKITFDGLVFI